MSSLLDQSSERWFSCDTVCQQLDFLSTGLRRSVRELFDTARDMEMGQPRLRICREGNNAGGMHHLIVFQGGRGRLGMPRPYVCQIAFWLHPRSTQLLRPLLWLCVWLVYSSGIWSSVRAPVHSLRGGGKLPRDLNSLCLLQVFLSIIGALTSAVSPRAGGRNVPLSFQVALGGVSRDGMWGRFRVLVGYDLDRVHHRMVWVEGGKGPQIQLSLQVASGNAQAWMGFQWVQVEC